MRKESKRQLIWQEIRKQKDFTLDSLASGTRIERETIRTYVVGLEKAGFVRIFDQKETDKPYVTTQFKTNCYVLEKMSELTLPALLATEKSCLLTSIRIYGGQ